MNMLASFSIYARPERASRVGTGLTGLAVASTQSAFASRRMRSSSASACSAVHPSRRWMAETSLYSPEETRIASVWTAWNR